MNSKNIILTITGKKFGKNFMSYKVFNVKENRTIEEGKISDVVDSRVIYKNLINVYGEEDVLLLQR